MKHALKTVLVFGIITVNLNLNVAAQHYFRSAASGNWSSVSTWEMSDDTYIWTAATSTPNYSDYTINIVGGHTVTITSGLTIDQLTINDEGILNANASVNIFISNGGSGADIIINGIFSDNITGGNSVFFFSGATWQISAGASLIKTTNSSSNNWQQNYEGGIQSIPSTANWIVRKNSTANPAITTVGAFYPNLIIENNTSSTYFTPSVACSFNGSSNFPTILGTLDIGGNGSSSVSFFNGQTNSNPTKVYGDFIIRTSNTFRNYGTGIEVQGNVLIDGSLVYDSEDRRLLDFSGSNGQTISGTGAINIYNMRMMKPTGSLTLNLPITIDDSLYLNNGYILSTLINKVIIADNAKSVNASSRSFIKGPVRKTGDKAYIFPIGTNGFYKPIAIAAGGTNDSYVAEYYRANPRNVFTSNVSYPLDHISACEYWQLTKESGDQPRSISLYWDLNSCGVVIPNELRIVNYDALSVIWNATGTNSISGNTSSGIINSSAVAQFGYFTLGSITPINPLPVTLIDFYVAFQSNGIHINWSTASEINNDHFEILSSGNAMMFESIGNISGQGNSTDLNHYSFFDRRPLNGEIYYRLKQVDFNGRENFSEIISVKITNPYFASVFPNPYSENTNIYLTCENKGELIVCIYDTYGKEMNRKIYQIPKGVSVINPEADKSFPTGIYFINLSLNDSSTVIPIIKQ